MVDARFGKRQWIELFEEIGLDRAAMHRWHATFERRWPEAHRDFLQWLGEPPEEIERIREASRGS